MTKRKSLDDILSNDRSVVRSAHFDGWGAAPIGKPSKPSSSYSDEKWGTSGSVGHSCYKTHPPLKLGDYEIYGGSCGSPIVLDANVYIGFDSIMRTPEAGMPWNGGISVFYPIKDMGVPHDKDSFKRLVSWTVEQLKAGKKVHCGCIGGHGRTGTFLSAVCYELTGNKDAIQYVRDNYCHKAVESAGQVEFLCSLYGLNKVKGAKEGFLTTSSVTKGEFRPMGTFVSIFRGAT